MAGDEGYFDLGARRLHDQPARRLAALAGDWQERAFGSKGVEVAARFTSPAVNGGPKRRRAMNGPCDVFLLHGGVVAVGRELDAAAGVEALAGGEDDGEGAVGVVGVVGFANEAGDGAVEV